MRYVVGEMTTRPRPGAPESPITQKGDRPDSGRKKEKRSDPMEMENPAKAQTQARSVSAKKQNQKGEKLAGSPEKLDRF